MWWLWAAQANPFLAGLGDAAPGISEGNTPANAASAQTGAQASCLWTPVDGFYNFSDNWAQITGQLAGDCMQDEWQEVWHAHLRQMFEQAVADIFSAAPEDRTDAMCIEGDVMRGDGQWATLELSLISSGFGGVQKLTILASDVSERRQMREQVEQAQQQSRLANHCRSSFLSNMSHELRTPLNAIMGFAQILEMQPPGDEQAAKEYLKHIRLSGQELLTKISDLIEMANIDTGETDLNEQPMNLSELVSLAIEMQSHRAFEKRVTLKQGSASPHLVIMADRSRLLHCITHLLSGAIEQSHHGGQVMVNFEASRAGVTLQVEDTGAGMSQRQLQKTRASLRCSQSYYRTDIDDVSIGLAVCKEMIELHGGQLTINSLTGRGTAITIQLPASCIVSMSAKVKRKTAQFG